MGIDNPDFVIGAYHFMGGYWSLWIPSSISIVVVVEACMQPMALPCYGITGWELIERAMEPSGVTLVESGKMRMKTISTNANWDPYQDLGIFLHKLNFSRECQYPHFYGHILFDLPQTNLSGIDLR